LEETRPYQVAGTSEGSRGLRAGLEEEEGGESTAAEVDVPVWLWRSCCVVLTEGRLVKDAESLVLEALKRGNTCAGGVVDISCGRHSVRRG